MIHIHMYVHTYIHMYRYIYMIHMYIYMYVCVCVYIHIYIYAYIYICICIYIYTYIHIIYIYIYISIHISIYIYIYICLNIHMYIYTHTYTYIYRTICRSLGGVVTRTDMEPVTFSDTGCSVNSPILCSNTVTNTGATFEDVSEDAIAWYVAFTFFKKIKIKTKISRVSLLANLLWHYRVDLRENLPYRCIKYAGLLPH